MDTASEQIRRSTPPPAYSISKLAKTIQTRETDTVEPEAGEKLTASMRPQDASNRRSFWNPFDPRTWKANPSTEPRRRDTPIPFASISSQSTQKVIRICEHQYLTFDRFQRILKVLSLKDSGDKLDTLTPCHGLHPDSRSVTNTSSQQPLRKCKRQHICFTANFKHITQKVSFSTIIGNSAIRFIRNLLSTNTRILKNSVKSSKSWTSSFGLTCGQATPP